jgi:hypothetical protein
MTFAHPFAQLIFALQLARQPWAAQHGCENVPRAAWEYAIKRGLIL